MPEESKESKAKKLAAARKKLKEYQQRGTASGANTVSSYTYADSTTNSGHVSSNISERSESELQLNGSNSDIPHSEAGSASESTPIMRKEEQPNLESVNYFAAEQTETSKVDDKVQHDIYTEDSFSEGIHNINAIQVLITEKSQVTTELNKFRTLCREKELEIEELRVQHTNATKRVDELTQRLVDLQKQQEQQRLHNAELQHKLAQTRAQQEDHSSHINELKQQLALRDERLKQLDADFKDKCNALELSQLRLRQLSDENNITKDNRVETLTQTQFMYEQQIRDLQAMVQQLSQDKEQANTQYQTYVQQLNVQVQQLNERNNELTDETTKLQEREKQLVDHIQKLEKEIQKNISRQKDFEEEKEKESLKESCNSQIQSLQERISEFESERYEFQLKIKSQEDRLNSLQYDVKQKDIQLQQLKDNLESISSEQPDKTKLLATMESDKVAASRALTQNIELKKQLDEMEVRFVQLTNDKADLMNRLDAEQYANREMHSHFKAMEERLTTFDERFKFKDEEMIRLSHENEVLKKELEHLKGCHKNDEQHQIHIDDQCDHHEHVHLNHHDHRHDHDEHKVTAHHNHERNCKQEEIDHHVEVDKQVSCEEATEENLINSQRITNSTTSPLIATEEAVEKLQERFTQLMSQCADLTEEKLRLEHLVMQLQSETETIGEYIALYQTQRRILKQREYEKAAQTAMLQAEREQMHERLTMLNNLVHSLGMELPHNQQYEHTNESPAQYITFDDTSQRQKAIEHVLPQLNNTESIQPPNSAKDFNSPESQQILHKIQDIITEIKENTKELPTMNHSVDQLNCCSGKFEVV